mgnify:CR=1 FL=1
MSNVVVFLLVAVVVKAVTGKGIGDVDRVLTVVALVVAFAADAYHYSRVSPGHRL